MPGIVGILSNLPAELCEVSLRTMLDSLQHEPFYLVDSKSYASQGAYIGWSALPGTLGSHPPGVAAGGAVTLLLTGELFQSPRAKLSRAALLEHWLNAYLKEGIRFVERLNGLFAGVIIDARSRTSYVFNDRYGVERLYSAQTSDGVFFASEAKALLRVLPDCRAFDSEGVAQFITFGCQLGRKTLFRGVELESGASILAWDGNRLARDVYFRPSAWESQEALPPSRYEVELREKLQSVAPAYFDSELPVGVSLTAGLDTRMILAAVEKFSSAPQCYTYAGEHATTLDGSIAKAVAGRLHLPHHLLRIEPDFFRDFGQLADKTVYVTDGCAGVTGSHEIYMSRKARKLAPIRVTGNFGGEILRGVSTFKPLPLQRTFLAPGLESATQSAAAAWSETRHHPVTFAAFHEVPWSLFGTMAAGRSQLTFRTPYLDNDFVALAYRAPVESRASRLPGLNLVRALSPELASIATDKGDLGNDSEFRRICRSAWSKFTFKLDYMNNEGYPNALAPLEGLFQFFSASFGLLGIHKHLHYRRWFRTQLVETVRDRLDRAAQLSCLDRTGLAAMSEAHASGRKNFVLEINAALTLEAVDRLMMSNSANPGPDTVRGVMRSKADHTLAAAIAG